MSSSSDIEDIVMEREPAKLPSHLTDKETEQSMHAMQSGKKTAKQLEKAALTASLSDEASLKGMKSYRPSGPVKSRPSSDSGILVFNKRILFTYKSPYLNSSVDITEYDRSRVNDGIMLNDSIVNFYLNYSLNQSINDRLQYCHIKPEDALLVLHDEFTGSEEAKQQIASTLDAILRKFYIFSSFFYPQLISLRKVGNEKAKKKVLKWAEDGHILEREFVFFPVFQHSHFSLAVLCYPNYLKKYIVQKRAVNGIDYKTGKTVSPSSQDKLPCIVVMDSLHAPDSSIPSNIRFFLNYLFAEQLPETAPNFTSHLLPDFSIPVVQQDNSVDCGVYMLNNVKKLLLMSDAFEIRCDHNDAAAVQKAFQPLRLGGNEVKLLRRQIAGAIDGLARSLGKDEFEEEEEDSIEEVEVLEKAKTPEKRPPCGVVEKQLPVTAYLHTSQTEYQKSFDGLMGELGKGVDPLTTLRTSTAGRKRVWA
ncbi:hypothetical protein WA556_003890 [Blastocystis sp. ATCC 50177/Nand II]